MQHGCVGGADLLDPDLNAIKYVRKIENYAQLKIHFRILVNRAFHVPMNTKVYCALCCKLHKRCAMTVDVEYRRSIDKFYS